MEVREHNTHEGEGNKKTGSSSTSGQKKTGRRDDCAVWGKVRKGGGTNFQGRSLRTTQEEKKKRARRSRRSKNASKPFVPKKTDSR